MEFNLLQKLIEEYRVFLHELTEDSKPTITDFGYWLNNRQFKPSKDGDIISLDENNIDEEISRLLVKMYRFARNHLKNSMTEVSDIVQEDFTYLYALKRSGSMTKTNLIELNVHEKSTGLEIIKRLIQNKLVQEKTDEKDKRSKRLTITEKGERLFYESKAVTRDVAKLIAGKLKVNEKNDLYSILKKLDDFHNPIYRSTKDAAVKELLDSYSLN